MDCSFCGKKIPYGSEICPECGNTTSEQHQVFDQSDSLNKDVVNYNQFDQEPTSEQTVKDPPVSVGVTAITQKVEKIPTRTIAKIAFLAALVCFLFPFISVSCDTATIAREITVDQETIKIEVEYKGYNILFPSTISGKNVTEYDEEEYKNDIENNSKIGEDYGSKEYTNPWLIITAICCIAGCVVLFLKRDILYTLIAAGCSLISLICLIIFRIEFYKRYILHGKKDLEGFEKYLLIHAKFGYILCVLMVILALISCLATYLTDKSKSTQNLI
ncbi:MAG: zinc ribbon domain-containing protein [Ruminococcus sp.]|uniref:zinc ribbon domain-containing protein n=1 Tax=Ruminococcus sp. TaxID=41978 RepID=UPI0025D19C4F|nr:zinc ribbon domain-containing protein [Ruminococcus sp.]MBO4867703.1 zinc ribbon domain-containing protein [Ruminococcus sp.]